MKRTTTSLMTLVGTVVLATSIVSAEWSQDPTARTPICTAEGTQYFTQLVAVENDFVAVWNDQRRGSCGYSCIYEDVYAQKFSIEGQMLWPENGRVIAEGPAGSLVQLWQYNTGLADSGDGGALIVWNDSSPGYYEQGFVTRASSTGASSNATVAWGEPGESIQDSDSAVPMLAYPAAGGNMTSRRWNIATDSEGGIFVPVDVATTGWLARFDAEGRLRANWFNNPDEIQEAYYPLVLVPVVEAGGEDGVIVVWEVNSPYGDSALASKRIDPESSWPSEPDTFNSPWEMVQLVDPEYGKGIHRLVAVPDGSGGAIAAWMDNRTESFRVYAQRIDANGNLAWGPGGVAVSGDLSSSGVTYQLTMAADGEGGAVVAWNDPWNPRVLKAQRLDGDGDAQWTSGGVVVCADPIALYSPLNVALIRATDGNFIVLYGLPFVTNVRPAQVLAQKLAKSDGTMLWAEGRTAFEYDGPYYTDMSDHIKMVSDGHAGAIVAFATGNFDIRAHRIEELLPDLTVNSMNAPRMLQAGKTVTVRVTVGNEGGANVSGSYMVSLFLDGDLLKENPVADAPAAGEETVVTMSGVRIPDLSSGNHTLEATVDTYASIPESDEANNTYSISVRVK